MLYAIEHAFTLGPKPGARPLANFTNEDGSLILRDDWPHVVRRHRMLVFTNPPGQRMDLPAHVLDSHLGSKPISRKSFSAL